MQDALQARSQREAWRRLPLQYSATVRNIASFPVPQQQVERHEHRLIQVELTGLLIWVEQSYSLFPEDLKRLWRQRLAPETTAAIERLMHALRIRSSQQDGGDGIIQNMDNIDKEIVDGRPHVRNPYSLSTVMYVQGQLPQIVLLDEVARRAAASWTTLSDVTRPNIEFAFKTLREIIDHMLREANYLQMRAMEIREEATLGRPEAALRGHNENIYRALAVMREFMRYIGTAPQGPPQLQRQSIWVGQIGNREHRYVPGLAQAGRRMERREDVEDAGAPPRLETGPLPTTDDAKRAAADAAQLGRRVAQLRAYDDVDRKSLWDWRGNEGVAVQEYSRNPQVQSSAAGCYAGVRPPLPGYKEPNLPPGVKPKPGDYGCAPDGTPYFPVEGPVRIVRAPKVDAGAGGDFDPTAWLQRRVKIPRQNPKAATPGAAGGKYRIL